MWQMFSGLGGRWRRRRDHSLLAGFSLDADVNCLYIDVVSRADGYATGCGIRMPDEVQNGPFRS